MASNILSSRIVEAFQQVDRRHFMTPRRRHMADIDAAVPIGFGQTISQPSTVAQMLLWLAPLPGQSILDIGSGSGWTTALLAYLVGLKGRVYAVERIPKLKAFGENNCRRFGCANVQFHLADNRLGLPQYAPYDRILVSAAAHNAIPDELIDQLAPNGKMVIPVNHSIFELQKNDEEVASSRQHYGFSFVPLVLPRGDSGD